MTSSELDELEESLGIELPDSYRRAIGRLARKKPRGMLTQLVCTDTQQLVEMNEHVSGFAPVAGLSDWPDDLFVIGTDGCGNYYAIRHDEEDSPSCSLITIGMSCSNPPTRSRISAGASKAACDSMKRSCTEVIGRIVPSASPRPLYRHRFETSRRG